MWWFSRKHRSHDHRKTMFKYSNKAFDLHPNTPDIDITLEFKLKVRIVGDCSKFTWEKARVKENGIAAFASHSSSENRIENISKMVNGQIVFNQARLGHELQHILSWEGPGKLIANPDKLESVF